MAKNTTQKSKAGNGAAADADTPTPQSLDQVRDILFGGQMRVVEGRLRGLEERLLHEQKALRNDLTRKLAEVEEAAKKDGAVQSERLAAERAKRADDVKTLAAELKESFKSLGARHQKLEETAALADAELRDQLMKHSAALSAELTRTAERLTAAMESTAASLKSEKVDTKTLASTLTEMAGKLTGGGRATGKGTARG